MTWIILQQLTGSRKARRNVRIALVKKVSSTAMHSKSCIGQTVTPFICLFNSTRYNAHVHSFCSVYILLCMLLLYIQTLEITITEELLLCEKSHFQSIAQQLIYNILLYHGTDVLMKVHRWISWLMHDYYSFFLLHMLCNDDDHV